MGNDVLNLIVLSTVLMIVIVVFIRIAIRLRKYGGSLTTTMFAATYEFLNNDKRKAVKEIVNMKTNKKTEEQKSDEPAEK